MYTTETSNKDRILAPRGWNMDFWLVFIMNRQCSVKQNANTIGFWGETYYFSKSLKIYVQHRNVWSWYNMGLTGRKFRFWPFFAVNKLLSIKLKANPLCVLSRKSIFFLKKFVYNSIMSNLAIIWAPRGWNTDFQPVFIVNIHFQ
jgi:hypothetical protein